MKKPVLVMYATVEGQSRKVAEYATARLRAQGVDVHLLDVEHAHPPFVLQHYRAALLVAPVHASFHPRAMLRFVREHLDELLALPVRFLSLSLSQAGVEMVRAEPEQRERAVRDVKHLVALLCNATGFPASKVTPVAGCLAYTRYNPLKRLVLRYIAKKSGGSTDTSRDHEYTDFTRVDQAVDALCTEFSAMTQTPATAAQNAVHALSA